MHVNSVVIVVLSLFVQGCGLSPRRVVDMKLNKTNPGLTCLAYLIFTYYLIYKGRLGRHLSTLK